MGRKFYISDTHFGHENVIGFDNRPFATVDDMDQYMIEYWNMRVQKDDEVYIVGDFQFRGDKGPVWYLKRLNGIKYLIPGNHDHRILKDPVAISYFQDIDKIMHITDNGRQIIACHYPITEWSGYYQGQIHIHGHLHNRLSDTCLIMRSRPNAYNAAAAINNYMPVTLDELIRNNERFVEQNPLTWADLVEIKK